MSDSVSLNPPLLSVTASASRLTSLATVSSRLAPSMSTRVSHVAEGVSVDGNVARTMVSNATYTNDATMTRVSTSDMPSYRCQNPVSALEDMGPINLDDIDVYESNFHQSHLNPLCDPFIPASTSVFTSQGADPVGDHSQRPGSGDWIGLDWICLTTTHILQDILAVLPK